MTIGLLPLLLVLLALPELQAATASAVTALAAVSCNNLARWRLIRFSLPVPVPGHGCAER
jgi:hypothetical protein